MAEFDGLANSFNQGVQSGQGDALRYAQMAGDMDLKKQRLDLDRQNLEETKRQRNMQVGQLFFGELDKISSMKSGKAKNARIKIMQGKGQELGLGNMEMLSALLQDEDGIAKIRGTISLIDQLPPELQEKTFEEAHKYLGDEEIADYMEKFQSRAGELLKLKTQKDLELRNDLSKEKTKGTDPKFTLDLSKEVQNIGKEFRRLTLLEKSVFDKLPFKDGTLDFNKMTPADDIQFIKGFNQLNDTAAVREGEVAFVQNSQGVINYIKTKIQGWKEGDKISPDLRREIYNTAKGILTEVRAQQKDAMLPLVKQGESAGVKPDKLFGPKLYEELKNEIPEFKLSSENSGNGGGASAVPLASPGPGPKPNPTPQPMYKTAGKSDVPPPDHTMVLREYTKKNPALVGETQKLFGQLGANTDKFKELATKSGLPQDLVDAIIAARGKKKSGSN